VFCTLPVAASAHVRHSGVNREQLWSHERRGAAGPGVEVSGNQGVRCYGYVASRSNARQMAVTLFPCVRVGWCTCDHGAMQCVNVCVPRCAHTMSGACCVSFVCRLQPDTRRRDGNCICLVSCYGAQHVFVQRCVGHGAVRRHVFVAMRSVLQHAWVVMHG